jgi:hypothetical protein
MATSKAEIEVRTIPPNPDVLVNIYLRAEQSVVEWLDSMTKITGLSRPQIIRAILLEVKAHGVVVEKPITVLDPSPAKAHRENHRAS